MRLNAWIAILLVLALGASSALPSLCAARCGSHATTSRAQHYLTAQSELESQDEVCAGCPLGGYNALVASDCANLPPADMALDRSFSFAVPRELLGALTPTLALSSAVDAPKITSYDDRSWSPDECHQTTDFQVSLVTLRI